MTEATSQQPTALEGLSRFLVEHEACGVGFDVSHPAGLGSGLISMECRGCGERFEYTTTTIEFEREIELEPVVLPSEPPTDAVREERPRGGPAHPPLSRPRRRRGARGRNRDRTIVAGLLIFAAAALAFAVLRVTGDGSSESSTTGPRASSGSSASPPAMSKHSPSSAVASSPKPKAAPAAKAPTPSSSAAPKPHRQATDAGAPKSSSKPGHTTARIVVGPARPGAGEKLVGTERFSLVVPTAWGSREEDAGGLLTAPQGSPAPVSIQAFFEENPSLAMSTMATKTADFLRSRTPGSAVGRPRRLRIGGEPAFELRDHGSSGSQTALGVLAGSFRYLVVADENAGASRASRKQVERALSTFRPR